LDLDLKNLNPFISGIQSSHATIYASRHYLEQFFAFHFFSQLAIRTCTKITAIQLQMHW